MSNCNNFSHTCGSHGPWIPCGNQCGCGYCGCGCSDGTPACNPCAPWGSSAINTSTCSCSCGNCSAADGCSDCSVSCGNSCSCGSCTQCSQWGTFSTSSGCLVPRIISAGRTFQRRIIQTLCIDDLPDCAESPLTLVGVSVCGQASWEQLSECRNSLLRVTIPVVVQVQDCAGRCRSGHSTVTLTIPLCMRCPAQDFWRGQLFVAPCIRLATPVTENEDGCFDAPLEVQADVYLVRMQVVNC